MTNEEKEHYFSFINMFANAPESQLDSAFSKECKEFSGDDPVTFLRNLQDKCVYFGGSYDFVVSVIDKILVNEIETEEEKIKRREKLNKEFGI